MPYDYSKLTGAIIECFGTQGNFAKALGMSERTVSLKLNGKVGWKQSEIAKICKLLNLSENKIPAYFFKPKVQY